MLANILDQVIKAYGKEFLGDWDPINNFRIDSLTDPEIHLTNIPFPQQLFQLAEIPFAVDYSNIAKVRAKFSWQTFFGAPGTYPFAIEADDLEIRIRLLYPSEWNSEFWRDKILKAKLKRTVLWEKFASLLGSAQGDRSSVAQTLEPRIVNSLAIKVRNIHVHIVDDNLGATPWAFECHVDEFCIDSPKRGDPRISDIEATGLEQCLLMGLWMRFVGLHFWYREFKRPQLEGKAGVSVNIDKARQLRRRLRRNPKDEQAQRLLSELLQRDEGTTAGGSPSVGAGAPGAASAGPAAGPSSGVAEAQQGASELLPGLQRLRRQGSQPVAGVDAGTLTNMLSKEIQETLHIEDQSVSMSLASRVLQWGWWCGNGARLRAFGSTEEKLTPLAADNLLSTGAAEGSSTSSMNLLPANTVSTETVTQNPAVAASNAVASAEAAAEAATTAKAVAVAALRSSENEGESSDTNTENEDDLLSGVRASRAFKVVPSQIKDLLEENTHAFRVTPKAGIEMHILFKKWELRALGSNLAANRQSWKTVELSFLNHNASLYSPLPAADGSTEQQSNHQEASPQQARAPPPPLFDGSMDHKPLQLTFTSAAVAALFNFIKLLDVWFIFLKGSGRLTRVVAREEECATYVEMWKRRLTAKAEMREVVDRFIDDFEYSTPLYLILKLRQLAEDNLTWRDGVSAAVLQKQIFGRFTGSCCGPDAGGSMQWATGETAETVLDDEGENEFTDKERLLLEDIACTVDEASGEQRGGFGGRRWFYIDGLLSVIAPNLCFRLLPLIQPGMHVNPPQQFQQRDKHWNQRKTLGRQGTLALLERLEAQDAWDNPSTTAQAGDIPPTTLMFRVCTDFKFRQEKRNDFFKCHDIFIDSVFVEKGFASLKARPCSEAILLRSSHNASIQTPFPDRLIYASSLGELGCTSCVYLPADPPSRLGWGIGPARPPLRGRAVEIPSAFMKVDESSTEFDLKRKDELLKSPQYYDRGVDRGGAALGRVAQQSEEQQLDNSLRNDSTPSQKSLPQRMRPSLVYNNIHAFFDRARHLADIVKKVPQRAIERVMSQPKPRGSIGGDKSRTILISISSKMVWDAELGAPLEKKKTWINIPEICVSAPELFPLAEALPMSFATWDLFREKDCLLPTTTEDAMGLALGEGRTSSSPSETSTIKRGWDGDWAERSLAAAAAGRPLAFLGERAADAWKEFEAHKYMFSRNSSSVPSLADPHSEVLSFSDSFVSPSPSDTGVCSPSAKAAPRHAAQNGQLGGSERIDDDSDADTFIEDYLWAHKSSCALKDRLLSDVHYEPVEAHGFASSCCGLKASATTLRLNRTVKIRDRSVVWETLNVSLDALEAAVMAQSPNTNGTSSLTTDCTVLSVFDVNVGTTKAPQQKVDVKVGRVNLGVCTQLISLAACIQFLNPISFPYTDALRDPKTLLLKLAQIGSLQRKSASTKSPKARSTENQHQQPRISPPVQGTPRKGMFPSSTGDALRGTVAVPAGTTTHDGDEDRKCSGSLPSKDPGGPTSQETSQRAPDAFLPVPTSGPWSECEAHRLNWFFSDTEMVKRFTSDISPLKFLGPGQENKESYQRWRVAQRRLASGKSVPSGIFPDGFGTDGADALGRTGTDTALTPLQISARVGCLCVGMYTQQQYLAVLLRIYEARVSLRKKRKDIRMKAKVGEFFIEHSKAQGTHRRSIVLCKKVVHIGVQCRRWGSSAGRALPSSPVPYSAESDPAALVRSEMREWSGSNQPTPRSTSSQTGRQSSQCPAIQVPEAGTSSNRRHSTAVPGIRVERCRASSPGARSTGDVAGKRVLSSPYGVSGASDNGHLFNPLQQQLLLYKKQQQEQELKRQAGRRARIVDEATPRNGAVLCEERVHASQPLDSLGVESDQRQIHRKSSWGTASDDNDEAQQNEKNTGDSSFPSSLESEEEMPSPLVTLRHCIHGRARSGTENGPNYPSDDATKSREKRSLSGFLRHARSRTNATGQPLDQNQHHHFGWKWQWRGGNAEDSHVDDAIHDTRESSLSKGSSSEPERSYGGMMASGEDGCWSSDVVGDWTLGDDRKGDLTHPPVESQSHIGHDCCFGILGTPPLNLLLFEDKAGQRREGRKKTGKEDLLSKRKDSSSIKRDQMFLSLRLQPESKNTEAQICLQSVHAFPTANLLCCLTDAALCLNNSWNEESIRSRCLLACLLGDVRSQRAARVAGLNLHAATEIDKKRPIKRQFTLTRRAQQQHRADMYSSRGSEGSGDTSTYSSNSVPPGGLSRGNMNFRKQAKTTFSRWGPPEGFSDDGSSLLGPLAADGPRRISRSLSGGGRRKRSLRGSSSKDKMHGPGASPHCSPSKAPSGTDAAGECRSGNAGVSSAPQQAPAFPRTSPKTQSETQNPKGVSVTIDLMLKDVTCNLLIDDANGPFAAEDAESSEAPCADCTAHADVAPVFDTSGNDIGEQTYVTQQHEEKRAAMKRRRRQSQVLFSSGVSTHSSISNGDTSSTASSVSTDVPTGGDAGLAFPPFPVLFSPDLCVPRSMAAQCGGLRFDSSLSRVVVADAQAIGVRLDAALRVMYTSVPTGSSTSGKHEELKDALQVGLWRLEATLLRNCTWAFASAVFFDLNFKAECLRLIPAKKRRTVAGTTKALSKGSSSGRVEVDTDVLPNRFAHLKTVEEGNSEEEGDTPGALHRSVWLADDTGDHPQSGERKLRRSRKSLYTTPWEHKPDTEWPEGYASAEGSVTGSNDRKIRASYPGLAEGRITGSTGQGTSRRTESAVEVERLKRQFSSAAPRRLPSSGSSSFFRRVFGSRNANNAAVVSESPAGSSGQFDPRSWRGRHLKRTGGGNAGRYTERQGAVSDMKNYTDPETRHAESPRTAGATRKRRPPEVAAPTRKVSPPVRKLGSSIAWPRNLLKPRRTLSTLNSANSGLLELVSSTPSGRGALRYYPFESDVATAYASTQSPFARHANMPGRSRLRQSGNVERSGTGRQGMRASSATPSMEGIVPMGSAFDQMQRVVGQTTEVRTRASVPRTAKPTATRAKREERRVVEIPAKECEEERELLTCTAIDLEVKRVAIWSAVYLQDNKAAANPCRAAGAVAALAAMQSRQNKQKHRSGCATAPSAAATSTAGNADNQEAESAASGSSKSHLAAYVPVGRRMHTAVGAQRGSPTVAQVAAIDKSRIAGSGLPVVDASRISTSCKSAGRGTSRHTVSRVVEEVQQLTFLLREVWTEDWLSVSLPSPPPFGTYFRAQEGRILLIPVLLQSSTNKERTLLQRRLQEAKAEAESMVIAHERHEASIVPDRAAMRTLQGMNARTTPAAQAALAGAALKLNTQEDEKQDEKKTAASERLRGAANISPHISLMYRLLDHSNTPCRDMRAPLKYQAPDGSRPGTKIVCRGDICPTFCCCSPFLVDCFTQLFGKDGEMTAVLSRLSMGLRAIRMGMQQQEHKAAEAARAAVQCLPTLANSSELAVAAPSPPSNPGRSLLPPQHEEPDTGASGAPTRPAVGLSIGDDTAAVEGSEEAALKVDTRLWGALPGSLLQLSLALRTALERLTHDSFVSLCIHSLQLTLPSPCQLLNLPAIPATKRLLPITAVRPNLSSEAFYFLCCLSAAPISPCIALDLIITVRGVRKSSHPISPSEQQQLRWYANNPAGGEEAIGSVILPNRATPRQRDVKRGKPFPLSALQFPGTQASPSAASAAAMAAPATTAAFERLAAAEVQQGPSRGSVKATAPVLRLQLLKRPRLRDAAIPSAQEVAQSSSPRIVLSQGGDARLDSPFGEAENSSAQQIYTPSKEKQPKQADCVLEVLLKDLEVTFVAEERPPDLLVQQQRLTHGLASRSVFGSAVYGGKVVQEADANGGVLGQAEKAEPVIEPFRLVLFLRDCIVRGEDGVRLLQNASVLPKLFSGAFATSAQALGGSHTPQGAASVNTTGTQASGLSGVASTRRSVHKTRLPVPQVLMSDTAVQDPLLQGLVWISDEKAFVSGELSHMRIQLCALQGATVYSWATSLFGALQQLKHFSLQFPAISFGCCYSTASWLSPVGVSTHQLLRVAQLQSQSSLPAVPDQLRQPRAATQDEQAVHRSLLLQRRGLGILCLLYPALPPPSLAPEDWHSYLPLQLPEMPTPMSIQQVLQVIEAEAAAREVAESSTAAVDTAVPLSPWRLETTDLFQHHVDLKASNHPPPIKGTHGYGDSSPVSEPFQGAHSADASSTQMPFGKSSPQGELRSSIRLGPMPAPQGPRRHSTSDAHSFSSPEGAQCSPDDAEGDKTLTSVRKPQGFWSRILRCFWCRRRKAERSAPESILSQGSPLTAKGRVSRILRSMGSTISGTSSISATPVESKLRAAQSYLSPSNTGLPAGRGERGRLTSAFNSSAREGTIAQWHSFAPPSPAEQRKPTVTLSKREAALVGAKLQKILELTVKGVELWFVLGEGGDAPAQCDTPGEPGDPHAVATIASLKRKTKARLKSLAAISGTKPSDAGRSEKTPGQWMQGQPLSRSLLQIMLTATSREGLCVEEECPDERRKQQIVVGFLTAGTLRLLQRGPDLNVCGEVRELSAMVGSPFPCSEFVQSKHSPESVLDPTGRPCNLGLQVPTSESHQQQQRHSAPPQNKTMKQIAAFSFLKSSQALPMDKLQAGQPDEGAVVLHNFPDVLEGYGGALLLPNLQQRTDCLLSVAPSTATISVALTEQQPLRVEDLQLTRTSSASTRKQPHMPLSPFVLPTATSSNSEKLPKFLYPPGSDKSTGGIGVLLRGAPTVEGPGSVLPSGVASASAAGNAFAAVRVTNYSVGLGDLTMEGSLLHFLRDYAFTMWENAYPTPQQRNRPLFDWASLEGGERCPKPAIIASMALARMRQQRRGGAFGRALEELNAMSSLPQQQLEEDISEPTRSSSSSSESASTPVQQPATWGIRVGDTQSPEREELNVNSQRRRMAQPQVVSPRATLVPSVPGGDLRKAEDEECVDSEELLLLAKLMSACGSSAVKLNACDPGVQRVEGTDVRDLQGEVAWHSVNSRRKGVSPSESPDATEHEDVDTAMPVSLLQSVGEADFKDMYCRAIGFFLSLLSFKLPGETEFEIKAEVVKGAFEFHDAHGSLLKVSLLALEGQVYIRPELWSADSVKKFGGRLELMVSGYDPMTNSQEELLHPVAASVDIQRQYVDGQMSHWSIVNIRSAMDGVSVDITSGLLQLVYHIVRTTREILQGAEGSLGRHNSLRVYNDIHSEVLVMHRRRARDEPRGWHFSRMQPEEWILAPTAYLYFAVRKNTPVTEAIPERRRRIWRRRGDDHEKLHETHPTVRLETYEDVKHVVEGLLQLGTRKVDNSWLRAYEETLLFSSTRRAQAPLEMLVDDMPVLQGGGSRSMRYGWESLLQMLRKEPGWCCLGRLHADYSNCRAYFLQNAGFKVLVEPVVDRRNGTWSLAVGSCVQLANACSMTLRVYIGRAKRNWGGRAISCFTARVTGETRSAATPEEYIDILPGCRRSVPLSWFGSGTVPSLAALLHTEGGEGYGEDREPEIPPVPFPALYRLTNKTGYTQPRRLDLPPFTLRLRGSLMLYGTVDTTDVPTSGASRIAQRYVIKLEPMLSIKNTLPFPITVSVYLRNAGESQMSSEIRAGATNAAGTGAKASHVPTQADNIAYAVSTEPAQPLRYAFGNPQAELLAELESRKRQKEEEQQEKFRGTSAKLVANNFVEATIPSHQSWGLPVGEQRLWLVLRVHGAPLEQFNTQMKAFNPTDGRPLGPLELQLLASAASRGGARLGGAAWLLQQEAIDGVALHTAAKTGESATRGTEDKKRKRTHKAQQQEQSTTVYESQRFAVLLPSQDTLTVNKVLQLKNGRGESLLPPGTLKLAKVEAMNQRRGKKAPLIFSEMQLAADVSRRQITVFAPYFFENLTDATLSVNGALVPSRCRLYTTEEDMRSASIRAYKADIWTDRVLQSSVSKKHDLSGISTARPPLVLKLSALQKQRGLRFGWVNRAVSATGDDQRHSVDGAPGGGGSVDSILSSLNPDEAARLQTLEELPDMRRGGSQGDLPLLKATLSSTDSFVDDETVGGARRETRLIFTTKRAAGAFGVKRKYSDGMSAGEAGKEVFFRPVARAKSLKVTVKRRVKNLGRGRSKNLRKEEPSGFDCSVADSVDKDTLYTGEGPDVNPQSATTTTAAGTQKELPHNKGISSPTALVLGLCTRYGDAPYSTTKIVSVIPRFIFISRLPFPVMVREVRSRSRVLGGAMGSRSKAMPCELALLPGETKAFHGMEPRVLLTHAEKSLVSCSFSLVPAHVPFFFQVEMTPKRGRAVYLPEHCTIIQVSIVSGLFGDVPALPYTYNGSFIVLSLPEHAQFAILNLTSYYLAHAPVERSRRTQQNQLRDDAFAIPMSSAIQAKSSIKKGRDEADGNLRLIPPWGSVPFIPPYHKNLENARVRLRVLDVEHCPWSVYSLASVDEDLQTIEFVPHPPQAGAASAAAGGLAPSPQPGSPRSLDGASSRKVPFLQRLPSKSLGTAVSATAAIIAPSASNTNPLQHFRGNTTAGGGDLSEGYLEPEEERYSVQEGDTRFIRLHTHRIGGSVSATSKERSLSTLYVFSLVAANGSRILIVAETPEVSDKLRAGGSAFELVREELVRKSIKQDIGLAPAGAVNMYEPTTAAAMMPKVTISAGSAPVGTTRHKRGDLALGDVQTSDGTSIRDLSQMSKQHNEKPLQKQRRPPPWLGLSFEFRLPRLTVTWIHQSEVVLALHLTGLSLSGSVNPRQLDAFLEAVPMESVMFMTSNWTGGQRALGAPPEGPTDSSSGGLVAPNGYRRSSSSIDRATQGSSSLGTDSTTSAEEEDGEEETISVQQPQQDYEVLVMTRSAVTLSARISMLHVDHFVKGDIPVILKNTTSKYGKEAEEFLEIAVVRSLVDPRQAPTYELLKVRISPFSANIELLVIEQLIRIYEKEVEMLHKFAVAAPQKPPALQTALKCSDAAEALRQLAVMDVVERNRREQLMAAETTAGSAAAVAPPRCGAASDGDAPPNVAAAAAAALLVHPLAMDVTHSGPINLSKLPPSLDNTRHQASTVGPSRSSFSLGISAGASNKVDSFHEFLLHEPVRTQFYASPRVYINPPSSHVLVLPNPRWMELHRASPVYIKNLTISSLSLTVSIRTSEHRISRQVLHIVDALPLDTPYMAIQIAREKRKFTVCSWHELIHSLRNSYLRQFIRQSLPSAWISNPCAFVVGFIRGASALFTQTIKGAKKSHNSFEGLMTGFRIGFILFIIYTMGGVMQSLSHVLNILHKLMRGSRPRPYGVLDAFWKGLNGMLLDTFWRPWVAVVAEPTASATRGDSWWKTAAILLACCVRCLISPLFGLSNFLASVAEGFANTLIGDFEQFTRVQERADLDKKHKHGSLSGIHGDLGSAGDLGQKGIKPGRKSSPGGNRDTALGITGMGRFRRGHKHQGAKNAEAFGMSPTTHNGSILTTKTRGSGSVSGGFRRPSSKQVTFAV
ncbi:hypothetical protein cyc_03597 [Cyclospora cayetanensis]|uniref:Uncharacterized protein n=1 Tax=Cyclospora cayetanensis TaxID=88456 RepID=A0A1D3CSX2_9EIME|nr:hypothetical protein cyc_03597 [Cyclospora cayetanensis]